MRRFPFLIAALPGVLLCPPLVSAPPNDDLASATALEGPAGYAIGNNDLATQEPGEPDHAGKPGGHSVWWSWTPEESGTAAIRTDGSTFDTLLAVYTGPSIAELTLPAADNDSGVDRTSSLRFQVTGGEKYQIAVDGSAGATGSIHLSWLLIPRCERPAAPRGPSPPDRAPGVALTATLRWNLSAVFREMAVYGNDDRLDLYQVNSTGLLAAWDSTAAVVPRGALTRNADGTYSLPASSLGKDLGLCHDEPFFDQPHPAICSAFLVAPDLLATAGHCVPDAASCSQVAFVFGLRMLDPTVAVLTFPADQVYFCKSILANRVGPAVGLPEELADWGLLRLDREVADHRPLPIRSMGRVAARQRLVMIGHPLGLPAKVAGGAWVREDSAEDYLLANLDSYGGNSGSAVLNAETLMVEGILVAGDVDLIDLGCLRTNHCPDDGCLGELVSRTTQFASLVPQNPATVVYRVLLAPSGGELALLGETSDTAWPISGLEPGKSCRWQVVAEGECGRTEGPVWSFTTQAAGFARGDATADGILDISDPIALLFHLFEGQPLPCLESADADDSGGLDLADGLALLRFLFLEGSPPPAPFPSCGADPTQDALGCGGYDACH